MNTFLLKGGYYIFNLLDSYVVTIPIFIIAFLESIAVGWVYGEYIKKIIFYFAFLNNISN